VNSGRVAAYWCCDECGEPLEYVRQDVNARGKFVSIYECTFPACSVGEVEFR